MKKIIVVISMMLVLPVTLIGCATTSELEKVQAEQKLIDAKAEQALQDAQAAKASADAAKLSAENARKSGSGTRKDRRRKGATSRRRLSRNR